METTIFVLDLIKFDHSINLNALWKKRKLLLFAPF